MIYSLSENDSLIVDATYHTVAPVFTGNPFIEALPDFSSHLAVVESLTHVPAIDAAWRNLDDELRLDVLIQLLQTMYQPVQRDVEGFLELYRGIKSSYASRVIADPSYFQKIMRRGSLDVCDPSFVRQGRSAPQMICVIGLSGSGKSSAVERWFNLFPKAIRHTEHKGQPLLTTQVPAVQINCTHDGRPKTLCIDFFDRIDAILDTRYSKSYGQAKNSNALLLRNIASITARHGVGAIAVDNVEQLVEARGAEAGILLNFLYDLAEWTRCVVVLIGTYDVLPLITKTMRMTRRASSFGQRYWTQLTKNDWDRFLKSAWSIQLTRDYTELDQNIADLIFHHSQGIPALALRLIALAQHRAIKAARRLGSEKITTSIIHSVALDHFSLLQPALTAIRCGQDIGKFKLPDLPCNWLPKPGVGQRSSTEIVTNRSEEKISPAEMEQQLKDSSVKTSAMRSKPRPTPNPDQDEFSLEKLMSRGLIVDEDLEGTPCN